MKTLLYGGRSQALIISEMLETAGQRVAFIFDPFLVEPYFESRAQFSNSPLELGKFIRNSDNFLVCIGNEHGKARTLISRRLKLMGLKPLSIVSPAAFIDESCILGDGCQVMPGAVLHKHSKVGDYSILNTNSTVDHECTIADGVHIMGAAAIAGRARIGDFATIGTNATILPEVSIGECAYVGAGAVVLKDVSAYEVVVGNPAKYLRRNVLKYDLSVFDLAGLP